MYKNYGIGVAMHKSIKALAKESTESIELHSWIKKTYTDPWEYKKAYEILNDLDICDEDGIKDHWFIEYGLGRKEPFISGMDENGQLIVETFDYINGIGKVFIEQYLGMRFERD